MGKMTEDRKAFFADVLAEVKASNGVSSAEVADALNQAQCRVAKALAELRDAGSVFMGGRTRAARWATTQAKADKASAAVKGGDA